MPYRRGVLMYGPPGNGKTSIIQLARRHAAGRGGARAAQRQGHRRGRLHRGGGRAVESAPAILVIEDLNWMIPERVSVSAFLNQLDGLATPRGAAGS